VDSVVIGADPHKLSVTIEVLDGRERVLHQGRYGTDRDGYRSMLAAARQFERRSWAVEGCNGIGRHDVARFATRARFASWNGTAPLDASSGLCRTRHRPLYGDLLVMPTGEGNRRSGKACVATRSA